MRHGTRLGVDVGTVRIGVAKSDPDGILATPLETIARGGGDIARVAKLVQTFDVTEVIVGLPIALSGRVTASTIDADEFARALGATVEVPVRLVDERMSTVSAHSALRASGRSTRTSRSVVDQVAAVIILQHALDSERLSAQPPGRLVDRSEDPRTEDSRIKDRTHGE